MVFPFLSALQGPIQFQLALSVFTGNTCECIAVVLGRVVDQTIVDCKNYL